MKVFLSVGATYNEEQEVFVSAFEKFLAQNGCERLTVGRGNYYAQQPLISARELMQTADGVVVVAFTRYILEKAREYPGSAKEKEIENTKYPTVWNQLEAAMAFGLKLPLLVIIETGLYQEAMLKDRLEYRALSTTLDPTFFLSDEFKGIFSDWKRLVEIRTQEQTKTSAPVLEGLTVGRIIKELRPDQFWKVGAAVFSVSAAIATGAYWIGKIIRP